MKQPSSLQENNNAFSAGVRRGAASSSFLTLPAKGAKD